MFNAFPPAARTRTITTRLVGAAFALGTGAALAAVQGELVTGGGASQGSIDVSIGKIFSVQISGLEDVSFGEVAVAETDFTSEESFCVFSSTGTFDLTMTSGNAGGGTGVPGVIDFTPDDMRMLGDSGDTMAYSITLDGDATPLTTGVAREGLAGDPTNANCGGTDNIGFSVDISADDFNAAAPGAYSDVLTMFVEPR